MQKWILTGILISYFAFTSGFVYETAKIDSVHKWETPYSVAMSADRTGLIGVFNDNDVACAKWLAYEANPDLMIIGGYNARQMVSAFVPVYYRLIEDLGEAPPTPRRYPEHCYLFYTTWNVENQKYIEPLEAGLRVTYDLPIVVDDGTAWVNIARVETGKETVIFVPMDRFIEATEVFRSGKAVVYEVGQNEQ